MITGDCFYDNETIVGLKQKQLNMKIESGKYVEIVYDLYKVNPDGTEELVHQVDEESPEAFVYGVVQGLVRPLEKDIEGKTEGYEFDVVATPEEGFGERSDEYFSELDKTVFEVDGKFDSEMVRPGNSIPMMTADGMRIVGTVVEVTPTSVKMDFNHPLAGSSVRFKGNVKTVRDATDEEIRFASGQGCCGGCGDNGCGDGGCGSGCGSGCGCN